MATFSVCLFIILIYKLHYIILWLVLSSKIYIFILPCNLSLSPLKLGVRIPLMARCTRYNIMWYSLSVTCDRSANFLRVLRFPPPIKIHCHDITEVLLKVTLNLTILTLTMYNVFISCHAIYLLLNQCVVHDYEMYFFPM